MKNSWSFVVIRVKEKMMNVENNQECFVQLWRKLERTRRLLGGQYKRFCIRNVLKAWFGYEATDDFIWEVCHLSEQEGWNELQAPSLYPLKHRELLRAIVAVRLGTCHRGRTAGHQLLENQSEGPRRSLQHRIS